MKLTYTGIEERVFPSLGVTVNTGDEIDAPDGFSHPDFASGTKSNVKPTTTPSAVSDSTAGE